jgi:MFS family permease
VRAVSRYAALLALPGARRLLASSLFARTPLGMSSLAILLFVRERTGSFAAAGAAVGGYSLASAALAPVQGSLVDRLGQRRILVPSAIGQAVLLSALVGAGALGAPGVVLVVLAIVAGALLPPFSACSRALWRVVAGDGPLREAAYALDAISQELIWIAGPLLVAGAVTVASPSLAVLLAAAVTAVGGAVFTHAPLSRRYRPRAVGRRLGGALASRGLRTLLASIVLTGAGWGALAVGLPALAVHVGSRGAAGLLLTLQGLGSLAGGLAYGARTWSSPTIVRYRVLLVVVALAALPLVACGALDAAAPLAFTCGLAWAPLMSCQYSLVGATAPAAAVTEAFTWNTAAFVSGIAAGSAIAGVASERAGASAPFLLAAATALAAAAVSVGTRRALAESAPVSAPSPDRHLSVSAETQR